MIFPPSKPSNWEKMDRWIRVEEYIVGTGIGCILAMFLTIILGYIAIEVYTIFWMIVLSDTVAGWIL